MSRDTVHTTVTEENYLKAIFRFAGSDFSQKVSTNWLAADLKTTPASVTDMIKKLGEKQLVQYTPYHGVSLTEDGYHVAVQVLRKHRLWEIFLVEKLKFNWDEVHETAEQLEHIVNPELVRRLDAYLGYPKYDPHGDPVPDEFGRMEELDAENLYAIPAGATVQIVAVRSELPDFLQFLTRFGMGIGTQVQVLEHIPFDNSRLLRVGGQEFVVSQSVARNVMVKTEA